MPKALIDGVLVDVPSTALFSDDGQTPYVAPAPGPGDQFFTQADLDSRIETARQQEKDKLYSRIESTSTELNTLRDQVGSLTAAEEARKAELETEQARLAEEQRLAEEATLSAAERSEKHIREAQEHWQAQFSDLTSKLETSEALREREREFNDLASYAQEQVRLHTVGDPNQGVEPDVAPQLARTITGNTREEIDASLARAVEISAEILEEITQAQAQLGPDGQPVYQQQSVIQPNQVVIPGTPAPQAPPTFAGSRAWGGPSNIDPAGEGTQTLTAEQIKNMPIEEYAKYRPRLGVTSGGARNVGMFG